MRPAIAAFGLIFVVALFSAADEPTKKPIADEPTNEPAENSVTKKQLLQRIEQLEKRLAALESRLPRPAGVPATPYAPVSPYRPAPGTRVYPNYTPTQPKYTPVQPTAPASPVRPPAYEGAPQNWQRFEFNGQTFYIVPAGQSAPKTTERR